jgi:hypothetical protein
MYEVPNEPHGEPRTFGSWLRDLSALALAILVLVYGVLASIELGGVLGVVLSWAIAPEGVLGPVVTLVGLIFVIALGITLSKRYGASKLVGVAQIRRAWLHLLGAAVSLIVGYYILHAILSSFFSPQF